MTLYAVISYLNCRLNVSFDVLRVTLDEAYAIQLARDAADARYGEDNVVSER
jgi:hypothetical protein